MIKGRGDPRRYAWIALLFAGYAALAHYTNSNPQAKRLGALTALAPAFTVFIGLTWGSIYRLPAILGAVLAALLLATHWDRVEGNFPLIYLFEDCGVYVLLGFTFARTLMHGRVPLCTYWADLVHGPLPAQVIRYTRNATATWAVFFALITCASLALFTWAPLRVWSAFSNFFTTPLVVLMFVAEYAVRRKVLPSEHRAGLLQSVRVYLDASRQPTVQGP